MIVALDGTPLTVPTGGVARYTAEIARALSARFPADAYWLLSDQAFETPLGAPKNLKRGPGPQSAPERKWWLWGLPRALARCQASVFLGTDFSVPYLPLCASVLMLHDLSPWREEGWHSNANRVRRRTPLLLRSGLATMVMTPTNAIRAEAIGRFRLAPDRVVAVPLAASTHFRRVSSSPPARPYFLYTGTLEPRKNIRILVDAWREVRREADIDLVIAGRAREDFGGVAPQPGLQMLGAVAEADMPALYSNASAFLFPSFYEGFGLPPLEAMQCGTPVITSNDPALVEVTGDAAIHVEARNPKDWAGAMRSLLHLDTAAARAAAGLKRAAAFSWHNTAVQTHEILEEAQRRFRRR